ncbi:DUF2182 domain-containing protein [Ralstonia sp. UBA689]|uniref:DUF2182 domain-containing protein n=1 Tax=Ralstonia sp. UBA689 TaxID=1947373 RepID=UPI00260098ED|nr:DUF2182 domain-containing protein [Ralstonia sp. UBA689]
MAERGFLAASALLFMVSTAATVAWCTSMSAMGEMPMPGGWTMPMCGQTWLGTTASFLGMWTVMMTAMMLPSLVPMLRRYRAVVRVGGEWQLGMLTMLVGVGYLLVWVAFGMVAFALGVALTAFEMHLPAAARAIPMATGCVVLIAGAFQFTPWKVRHLARCRAVPRPGRTLPANAGTAWRHGVHLGLHCSASCVGLTMILLAAGVMDLRVMVAITVAITLERLAPAGERVARIIGAIAGGAGLLLIARAVMLG